ncbi:MAG: DUF302 domain-containing protein [Gammaproteobacteria bacterium]
MRGWRAAGLLGALCLLAAAAVASEPTPDSEALVDRYRTDKSFDDVVFELDFAITERNFRITGRNTIGKGLRERGYADFPDVEVIHFCSLELAREVLLLDPAYVAQMPCRITVHEEDETTVVSVIRLPVDHRDERVNAFARRMNATLAEIAEFAVGY